MKTILIVIRIMLFISLALFSLSFFLGRCGFKCGHIFSNSSSSQIPRILCHKRVIGLVISIWVSSLFDFFQTAGFCAMYLNTCYGTFWKCWCPSYNSDLHQTPQESDSGPASTTRDTGWRCNKFCQYYQF